MVVGSQCGRVVLVAWVSLLVFCFLLVGAALFPVKAKSLSIKSGRAVTSQTAKKPLSGNKGSRTVLGERSYNLRLEKVAVEECSIWILIKKKGAEAILSRDYENGGLRCSVKTSHKALSKVWKLSEVDPRRLLNSKNQVYFNTGLPVQGKSVVSCELFGVGKGRRPKIRKSLRSFSACLRKGKRIASPSLPGKAQSRAVSTRLLSVPSPGSDFRQGKSLVNKPTFGGQMSSPPAHPEKMQRFQTLEELGGKRMDVNREKGFRMGQGISLSGEGRTGLAEGSRVHGGLPGSQGPEGNMPDRGGSPGGGKGGRMPHQTYSWSDFWHDLIDYANNVGFPTPDPYNVEWYGQAMHDFYMTDDETDRPAREREPSFSPTPSDSQEGADAETDPDEASESDSGEEYVNPESLGERRWSPWSAKRKPSYEGRDEATGVQRRPHGYVSSSGEYEKRKKEEERGGGAQVNPGLDAQREKRTYDQGAETLWRMKTYSTNPDVPQGEAQREGERGVE